MSSTVTIFDESAPGKTQATFILELDVRKLTLRELIRQRVREEVARFNAARGEVFQGLIEPTESERVLNGYKLKKFRTLDWQRQFQTALGSFAANGFFVLVDGEQIEELDEPFELGKTAEVRFIKLMPLVGG